MSEATEMLAEYIAAEKKVLKNQSYTIDSVSYTRADLATIREGRKEWQRIVNQEKARARGGSDLYNVATFGDY